MRRTDVINSLRAIRYDAEALRMRNGWDANKVLEYVYMRIEREIKQLDLERRHNGEEYSTRITKRKAVIDDGDYD